MRIIGLDPGTATTGYGIIDVIDGEPKVVTWGAIRTSAGDETPQRLQQIYDALVDLLQQYKPDAAAIEEVFFGRNITTAISVGQSRGVLILALAKADLPVAEYSPPKVKDAVTGYGKADKHQVQLMVRNLLRLDETPRPDDAADGLAVALTHYQHSRFAFLVRVENQEP
jgi:crossover junction endodeoxyribonuclease RuvC